MEEDDDDEHNKTKIISSVSINSNGIWLRLLQANDQENPTTIKVLHYSCVTVNGNKLVKSFAHRNTENQRYLS
jgi:hypothetical protein